MIVHNFLVLTFSLYCKTRAASINNFKIDNATTNKIDLVDVIKQDLRHNNDDYKELEKERMLESFRIKSTDVNKIGQEISKNSSGKLKGKHFRRNIDNIFEEYDYDDTTKPLSNVVYIKSTIKSQQTKAPLIINNSIKTSRKTFKMIVGHVKKNLSRLMDIDKIVLPTLKTFSPIRELVNHEKPRPDNNIPKFVNKKKIDKYKQFMKKNEGLLKNFMNSKLQPETQTTQLKQLLLSSDVTYFKPKIIHKKIKMAERTGDMSEAPLPNPDVLDMAPAKGARVHRLRLKGNLCHRHVLMPEGPKYDSRGRWYVPAHALVARRPYRASRRPRLLLPRCCNCCRKSVLGCE